MARTPCFTPHQKRPRAHIARGHLACATIGQGQFHPSAVWCDFKHYRPRAVGNPLEIVRAAWLLVQGDAGLVRRFELDLVTHSCGGENRTRHERHKNGNEEGCMTQDTEGDATNREVHHVMTCLCRARRMFGRRALGAG